MPVVHVKILGQIPTEKDIAQAELPRRVQHQLQNFSLQSDKTLAMMRKVNCILSGSAALEIAVPDSCTPGDLDFYCPLKQLRTVVKFFVQKQGYIDTTPGTCPHVYGDHIAGIRAVKTLIHSTDPTLKINIIESTTISPHAPIILFHSTPVMDFVSGDGIGVFYPALTSQRKGKVAILLGDVGLTNIGLVNRVYKRLDRQSLEGIVKYMGRGFQIADICEQLHDIHVGKMECHRRRRATSDGHMCSLAFDEGRVVTVSPQVRWVLGLPG